MGVLDFVLREFQAARIKDETVKRVFRRLSEDGFRIAASWSLGFDVFKGAQDDEPSFLFQRTLVLGSPKLGTWSGMKYNREGGEHPSVPLEIPDGCHNNAQIVEAAIVGALRREGLVSKDEASLISDQFYSDLDIADIGKYQAHFEEILKHVDVANSTSWAQGQDYDRDRLEADDEFMVDYVRHHVEPEGLKAYQLGIMVNQFFFADMLDRVRDESRWVERVLTRRFPDDYFPAGGQVSALLSIVSSAPDSPR